MVDVQAKRKAKLEALRPKAPPPQAISAPVQVGASSANQDQVGSATDTAETKISPTAANTVSPPAIVQDLLPLGADSDLDLSGRDTDALLSSSSSAGLAHRPSSGASPNASTNGGLGDTSTLLSHHRSEQDSLSSELATMASRLKANSLVFSSLLEKDKQLLSNAEEKLEGNLTGMTKERERLKGYSKKGGVSLWFTIGAVGAVAMAWFMMFALMRVL